MSQVSQFGDKIAWRHVLRNQTPNWFRQFATKSKTPVCNEPLDKEISSFKFHLRNNMHDVFLKQLKAFNPKFHSTWFPALTHAREWVENNGCKIVPSDKDGGWVLMWSTTYSQLMKSALDPYRYLPVGDLAHAQFDGTRMREIFQKHYVALAKHFRNNKFVSFFSQQARSISSDNMFAKVKATIKTHKPSGLVTPRIIHASPSHCLAAFSRYLNMHLSDGLRECSHIYRSSDSLLQKLSRKTFSRDCKFVTLDVGDFYLNGSPSTHKMHAFNHVNDTTLRNILKESLLDLLSNQVVVFEGRQYLVTKGSGQGQIISGELSDTTFYQLVEKNFACVSEVQLEYGIEFYGRYRDDILLITSGSSGDHLQQFVRKMKLLINNVYPLTCEKVSRRSIDFLDFTIFKGSRFCHNGRLAYKPFFKPTDIRVPLHATSAHNLAIHRSWPRSELGRLSRHSSNDALFQSAKNVLFDKWSSNYMCASTVSFLCPSHIQKRPKSVIDKSICWLVSPYLSGFDYRPIRMVMKRIELQWSTILAPLFGGPLQFDISYKNREKNNERLFAF